MTPSVAVRAPPRSARPGAAPQTVPPGPPHPAEPHDMAAPSVSTKPEGPVFYFAPSGANVWPDWLTWRYWAR